MTIPIFDTNLLYALLNPSDPNSTELLHLRHAGIVHVSDISILEWIVRHAQPTTGNLQTLQDGLALIDEKQLKRLHSPYISLSKEDIDAFRNSATLQETATLHSTLTQKRINIEFEWLRWALVIALGAYVSHCAHKMFGTSSPHASEVTKTAGALLGSNLDLISDTLYLSIKDGYATGAREKAVNEAIDVLRTSFITATRVAFSKINGQVLTESQINQTLETDHFRAFIRREAKAGKFSQFAAMAKADILKPGSPHTYTVEYIFARLDGPLNLGANHQKNDVNDAFIVGHLVDPNVTILTRDKKMATTLSKPPFRAAISLADAIAKLPSNL